MYTFRPIKRIASNFVTLTTIFCKERFACSAQWPPHLQLVIHKSCYIEKYSLWRSILLTCGIGEKLGEGVRGEYCHGNINRGSSLAEVENIRTANRCTTIYALSISARGERRYYEHQPRCGVGTLYRVLYLFRSLHPF